MREENPGSYSTLISNMQPCLSVCAFRTSNCNLRWVAKSGKFSSDEENNVSPCAWITASEDPVAGVDQTAKLFVQTVRPRFIESITAAAEVPKGRYGYMIANENSVVFRILLKVTRYASFSHTADTCPEPSPSWTAGAVLESSVFSAPIY